MGAHHGPRQPEPFDPQRAAMLDDPARDAWMPAAAIVALVDAPPNARVLDYGTGTARYAIALARERPDTDVVAYDNQAPMLHLARERIAQAHLSNARVAGPDADALRPGFARILAINVLHELDSDDLTRTRALLSPDGALLAIDWDARIARPVGPPAAHVYAPDEAIARLADAGFAATQIDAPQLPYHYVLRATHAARTTTACADAGG